ncbi:MAG: outer membrane protein assembly factor BamB family protein [Planctomycetota bacterium]
MRPDEAKTQVLENGIMKSIYIVLILTVMIIGCKRQQDQPPTEEQTDEQPAGKVDTLIAAIENGDVTAVVAAADAIETIGPKGAKAAPALASKLDDPQPWVRMACMHALQAIGEPAVPSLLEVFQTGPGGAPVRAVNVLGNIGPPAKAVVPELRKALQERPESLHSWINGALAKIEGDGTETGTEGGPQQGKKVVLPAEPPLTADRRSWPQFHGPNRDSICRETGLNTDWNENPPALLWKIEGLGIGYSSISIADGKIFAMGDRKVPEGTPYGGNDGNTAQFVLAYDLQTQNELWAKQIGPGHKDGPRSIPTIDGEFVYALGTEGDLVCLDTTTGTEHWRKSLSNDFGGKMMSRWKFSESPLVDGPRLICTPGGPEATLIALDKKTGSVIWKCAVPALGEKGNDGAGYASAIATEIDGVRQYIQLIGRGLVGVEAETGKFLWGYNGIANKIANIPMPIIRGQYVFTTTDYNTGSALLRISRVGDTFHVEELYTLTGRQFENHHGGIVLVGNHVYGGHGNSRGEPKCVEVATGKLMWKGKAPERGSASVIYADGHLWFRYDRGLIALVEATPDEFRLKGTFQPITGTGPAWAHPVILDGKLFLRHGDLLACYDVSGR